MKLKHQGTRLHIDDPLISLSSHLQFGVYSRHDECLAFTFARDV